MLAVYKRELRSYFYTMTGYIFMAFLFVVVGIYFTAFKALRTASPVPFTVSFSAFPPVMS